MLEMFWVVNKCLGMLNRHSDSRNIEHDDGNKELQESTFIWSWIVLDTVMKEYWWHSYIHIHVPPSKSRYMADSLAVLRTCVVPAWSLDIYHQLLIKYFTFLDPTRSTLYLCLLSCSECSFMSNNLKDGLNTKENNYGSLCRFSNQINKIFTYLYL